MSDDPNTLGEYLRARRELGTPESVALPQFGLRRVPGLRREEVAMLAGISADYYLRLEQGRDRNPSVQVLESLARVLQLDETGNSYLLSLGREKPRRARRRPRKETVPAGVLKLLGTVGLPAFVEGRYFDVLAANPLATAISPRLVAGRGRARRPRGARLPPVGRPRHRRPPVHRAGRRAVAGQRPVPGAGGPPRR